MKNAIFKKIIEFIWKKILTMNWKGVIYYVWENQAKPFLKDLVKKSTNQFDDAMLEGLDRIIQTFFNPSESLQMDEKSRGEAFKEFFKKAWTWIVSKLKDVDWQALIYKFWKSYARNWLQKLVKDSSNKFDDIMFEAIERIVEKFLNPENPSIENSVEK